MIAIIADDLTGANDTGVQYKKNGFSTIVKVSCGEKIEREYFEKYDVLSINSDTRPLSGKDAYKKVFNIAKQIQNAQYIYKKIDSIMRGNPAQELLAVMDSTGAEIALVAPSFPENGRKIENGILVMPDGKKTDVTAIFSNETGRNTFNIILTEIRKGFKYVSELIDKKINEGFQIFVLDAVDDNDLMIIKKASENIQHKKVLCGSAGFAKQLSLRNNDLENNLVAQNKGIIFIAIGSRSKETSEQIKKIVSVYNIDVVKVNSKLVYEGKCQAVIRDCEKEILQHIQNGEKLIVLVVDSLFDGYTIKLRNSESENSRALEIVKVLGSIASYIYDKTKIDSIISAGGDTSLQICSAFGAIGIELTDEILPGVPAGSIVGGKAQGVTLVTKSGGFGDENTLINVIKYLKKE